MLLTTKFFFALQVSLLAVAGLPTTDDTCPLPADTIYLSEADLHVRTLILNFCVDAPTHRQLRMFVTSLTEPIKHPLQHFFDSGHGATRATMLLTTKFFFAIQIKDDPQSVCFVNAAQYGRSSHYAVVAIDNRGEII
ncbi:hypothetical protein MTO96_051321 [Rhipicephalus appendiculatus]